MEQLLQDLKYALRIFRASPVFAATIVAALTLGIGVNTAIFSVVNAVLLKPIPIQNPDTLVQIATTRNGHSVGYAVSPVEFMYWRSQTDIFQDVAAFERDTLNYTSGDIPTQLAGSQVSEAYFRVYGAHFVKGRPFTAQENQVGGPNVAVVSYDFWQQHLAGAANVIGTRLPLNGDSYTIVGVVGRDFDLRDFGGAPDVWVPLQLDSNTGAQGNYLFVSARLKHGVTLAEARARLEASVPAFRKAYPNALGGMNAGFSVVTAQQAITRGNVRTELWVLLGAVGFVLLIACTNVANLLLVRATARRREVAIRSALGAGRLRIVRQLVTESVVLAAASGVLGLILGFAGMRALLGVNTARLPRLGPHGSLMGLDWRVVTFTLLLSIGTGILFGLVPALAASRTDLNTVIKDSGSRSGGSLRQNKTRSLLVTAEVALAVVLLIGAALLIRTTIALGRVDPGFDTSHTLVMRTSLSGSNFQTSQSVAQTERAALDRVRAIPGVESAAASCCVPLESNLGLAFNIVGRPHGKQPFTGIASFVTTSTDYFTTFGIPIIQGRAFDEHDGAGSPPVAVINEAMAKEFWSRGQDPLHDRLLVGADLARQFRGEPVRRIIGIVGNVRAAGLGRGSRPMIYVLRAQLPDAANAFVGRIWPLGWVVRTRGDPIGLATAVRKEITQATGLPVVDVKPMKDVVSLSVSRQRLNMLLMVIFGGSALLLAAIGIYGLMAYSVQQRTQEIGLRMALGADSLRLKRMVVREGIVLVSIGIAAGLVASFYTANVLSSFLFQVKPRDPTVFIVVPVALVLIALASVFVPAARASHVDPLKALRYE